MQNIKMNLSADKKKLLITIDLMADTAPSKSGKSGKSNVIATTSGIVEVPGTDVKLGLNLFRAAT